MSSNGSLILLTFAAVVAVFLWFLGTLVLRRFGPWKGDARTWKLAGLLVGSGFCLVFMLLFFAAFGLQEGVVTSNGRARSCLVVAVIGLPTLGFLAYRLDRDIRHPKSHA